MDFELSEDQQAYRESVLVFARDRLSAPPAPGMDRSLWQACSDVGLAGLTVPVEHGGQGADVVTAVVGYEALGEGSDHHGLAFALGAHLWSVVEPIARFGSDEQKHRWLRGLADGSLVGAHAMTEPDTGSDALALRTRAEETTDGWLLNGTKTFVTNAPVGDLFLVFATTDPDRGWAGLCAFVVERDTPGLDVGPAFDTMGLDGATLGEVVLDGCAVGPDALLGRRGAGMAIFAHSMEAERTAILAPAVGAMQRQVDRAVDHARERRQFGQPIGSFQAVSHRIADMALRARASRLLLYEAATKRAAGRSAALESSMVKLMVSESWTESSMDQLMVFGGAGYLTDVGVEHDVRDALASRVYSGTSDIQRNLIARHLGL